MFYCVRSGTDGIGKTKSVVVIMACHVAQPLLFATELLYYCTTEYCSSHCSATLPPPGFPSWRRKDAKLSPANSH